MRLEPTGSRAPGRRPSSASSILVPALLRALGDSVVALGEPPALVMREDLTALGLAPDFQPPRAPSAPVALRYRGPMTLGSELWVGSHDEILSVTATRPALPPGGCWRDALRTDYAPPSAWTR